HFVTVNQCPDQTTAHNVIALKLVDVNIRQSLNPFYRIRKAVGATDIALIDIAINHDFAIFADAGEEHFHLGNGGILRFVQHHKGIRAKGFTAHKSQGCSDNPAVAQIVVDRTRTQALVENIAKSLDIHREFFVE